MRTSRVGLAIRLLMPLSFLLMVLNTQADNIGGIPRHRCKKCEEAQSVSPCLLCRSDLSITEGNMSEDYHVVQVKSAFGVTLDLVLTYNSFDADGSNTRVDSGLGYGWTHTYNEFLFQERGHMFRMDGEGRITKYKVDAGGTFVTQTGYFELLVANPNGSFTLTRKDQTQFNFALVPNTPFLVLGPVYRLTKITDRNGNTTTITYNAGLLTQVEDTYGRKLTLTYDAKKKISKIMDPFGRQTQLLYDSTGRKLTTIKDPAGKSTSYGYNASYQIIQEIDRDGRRFSYQYANGRPIAFLDGAGSKRWSLSNPINWAIDNTALNTYLMRLLIPSTTTVRDGRGNPWKYDYDANGYITRRIAPDGATTLYTYDPATLELATTTDANLHSTSYLYDALGNLIKKTDALGNVSTFTYEPLFSQMTSMTDPKGRITTYEYDANGNRIKETDPLGQVREWTYDSHGNVLTEEDKRGFITSYEYDAFGHRVKLTDALGNVSTMTYDALGNILSRTDANNHVNQFLYDALYRLSKQTDPFGATILMAYDGEGNRISMTDRNGHSTTSQYDLRKRLIKTTDALGLFMMQTYDGNDNRTSMTDKNGHTTSFTYDVQNRLTNTTDALGNLIVNTYDPVGNVLSTTDPNGHAAAYTYDALNRRIAITDAIGNVTQFEYDQGGIGGCGSCGATPGRNLITKQIDGNGNVTYFKYDELDRQTKIIRKEGDTLDVIDPSDAITMFTYDPNNNRLSVTEPNGNTATTEYDPLNRRIKETNAAGDVTTLTYDGVGNLVTSVAPNGNVTVYTYDALDRLIQVDDSIGRVMSFSYDPDGNRLSQTDGNGNTTGYAYDAIDRIIKVTDPLGEVTLTQYDAVGNVLKVTDRNGNMTTQICDNINRRIQTTDALGHSTQFKYDPVGNLTNITDANLHTTQYAYDGINRLIQETYPDSPPNTRSFTYDAVGNRLTRTDQKGQVISYAYNDLYFLLQRSYPVSSTDNFTYDLSGRMLTAERGGWLVTFAYDGANRVTETAQGGETISYVYDIPGKRRTMTYPGGRTIVEQADFRSRLASIDDAASPPPIVQYTYDLGNRVLARTYRNGTVATYTYNANNWVLSLEHTIGATRIAGFGYADDKEGNKTFEEKRHDITHSEAYQYDNIYRLINYKVGSLVGSTVPVPTTQNSYNLDAVGNWNAVTRDGIPEVRTHNEANEIVTIDANPLTHDPNGNLIHDSAYTYFYDEENRLVRVTRNADSVVVGQYQYDALSRRIAKIANADGTPETTLYFHDAARIIEEQDIVNLTQATYTYGNYVDEVLTMDRAGTFYYHQNALWSVAAASDGSGNPVERYAYDAYGCPMITDGIGVPVLPNAWGTPHSAIENPYMFTGRQLEEETGLYYYRARYYDCLKGRFLQRDRLGFSAGMNLYEYVNSKPTRLTDPLGLVATSLNCPDGDPKCKDKQCTFEQQLIIDQNGAMTIKWSRGPLPPKKGEEDKICCWSDRDFKSGTLYVWYDGDDLEKKAPCEPQAGIGKPTPPAGCGAITHNTNIRTDPEGFIAAAPRDGKKVQKVEATITLQISCICKDKREDFLWIVTHTYDGGKTTETGSTPAKIAK